MAGTIQFRDAGIADIEAMHEIRISVKENVLVNQSLVTRQDYENYLTHSGKGWLAEENGYILGFGIIDTEKKRVWALFVDSRHESRGIGRRLQKFMLDWYFKQNGTPLWLHTAPGTRAEQFYRMTGWLDSGLENGDIRFEMSPENWMHANKT